jgi:hypothetical protein
MNTVSLFCSKLTLDKTEGTTKNGQSREMGNIEYTRHWRTTNKAQKTKKKSITTPPKTGARTKKMLNKHFNT